MPTKGQSLVAQKAQFTNRKVLQEVTGELSKPFMGQLLVKQVLQSAF